MANPNELEDGFSTLEAGMDSGRAPELINPNQVSFAINTTFRGSYGKTRPPFRQPAIGYDSTDTKNWFTQKRVQGAGYYNLDGRTPLVIVGVGGRLFEKRMNGRQAYIHDITPLFPIDTVDMGGHQIGGTVDLNSSRQPQIWTVQADQYFIVQDNLSKAIIYDGATTRRATKTEIPVGSVMAYGLGRIAVAQGDQFLVGDISGGPTSVLSFTETNYLNGGGAFKLPTNMGNITGMTFMAKQDSATGQGILLIFAERGVASVDLSQPRANWQATEIQEVALLGIGSTGPGSIVLINDDVFFRAPDGYRSYRNTSSQFGYMPQFSSGGNWMRTPISFEIKRILEADTPWLLRFASGVCFDNRYLLTASPQVNEAGAVHRGISVMDFAPVTSTQNPKPACFDGLSTGVRPVSLVTGDYPEGDRCFAICTDPTDGNEVWEILKKGSFDNDNCDIESVIETKAFIFGDANQYKSLLQGFMWIANLAGPTEFNVEWRPDQYPLWTHWHRFIVGQPTKTCGERPICGVPSTIPLQYRAPIQLPMVPDNCDPNGTRNMLKKGYSFTFRIRWKGSASITRFLVMAKTSKLLLEQRI